MVNVGGRSRGCTNCRRRKIKCDESAPICNRCKLKNLPCDGARDITFITATIVKSRRSQKGSEITPHQARDDAVAFTSVSSPEYALQGPTTDRYVCYSRRYFLKGAPLDLLLDKANLHDALIPTTSGKSQAQILDQALLSFATVIFGSDHHQVQIKEQGYATHEVALKTLNSALSTSDCAAHDEVILAIAALAMMESLRPTSPGSYIHHMVGMDKVLRLRDPLKHTSPMSLNLYKSIRHFTLFSSLRTGRASCFASAAWKQVLRMECTSEELAEQDVWDVLADCSILQVRCNILTSKSMGPSTLSEHQELTSEATMLFDGLIDWKARFGSQACNAYSETFASRLRDHSGRVLLPVWYHFPRDITAKRLMLYHTALIHVLHVLRTLKSWDEAIENVRFDSLCPPRDLAKSQYDLLTAELYSACEIARCTPYAIRPDATSKQYAPIIHWAVSVAWNTLKHSTIVEAEWLADLIRSERGGLLARGLFMDQT